MTREKDIRSTHQQQDHQSQPRPEGDIRLEIQLKRNRNDVQVEHRVHDIVRDQRSSEHGRHLASVSPAFDVSVEKFPGVGDNGAWEQGYNEESEAPDCHEDDSDDAETAGPCALVKDAEELEQDGQLDKGR